MLKTVEKVAIITLFILSIAGCVTFRGYHVMMNGFSNLDSPLKITPKNSFRVLENEESPNAMFEKEVVRKLTCLLEKNDLVVTTYDEADFFVVTEYGFDREHAVQNVNLAPLFDFIFFPEFDVRLSGFTFVPDHRLVYDHWLETRVIDAREYRKSGEDLLVWLGQVTCTSANPDLRDVINFMLAGTMEIFGKDTGKAQVIRMEEWDKEVAELRTPESKCDSRE